MWRKGWESLGDECRGGVGKCVGGDGMCGVGVLGCVGVWG